MKFNEVIDMCLTEAALVLEGGGMRGAFTAGVLDWFLDNDLMFNRVYAVSMGACNAMSYLSRQRGRAFRVVADYINDSRYAGYHNVIFKGGNFFPEKFVYHTIPEELDIFDTEAYDNYKGEFYAAVTDCNTGKPVYLRVKKLPEDIDIVRASASLPGFSRIVKINGEEYLDGGMVDSMPVKKAVDDGNKKVIVVLTRDKDYIKEPSTSYRLTRMLHPLHPKLSETVKDRHIMYNETLKLIDELEERGDIFVIRPNKGDLGMGRLERDRSKLEEAYRCGYDKAVELGAELMKYLGLPAAEGAAAPERIECK